MKLGLRLSNTYLSPMSEKLTPKVVPMSAEDVLSTTWAARVRSAITRDNQPVRMGQQRIEAKCLYTGEWRPIMLPNGGVEFTTANDCKTVFWCVTGND